MSDALTALRAGARAAFDAAGVPHRRVEAWKYSDLRARLARDAGPIADVPPLAPLAWATIAVDGARVAVPAADGVEIVDVLANGLPTWAQGFGALIPEAETPMARLALAEMTAGLAIRVKRGADAALALDVAGGADTRLRIFVTLEATASLRLVERRATSARHASLAVEGRVGSSGRLDHLILQDGPEAATLTAQQIVALARDARFGLHVLNAHRGFARQDVHVRFDGANAEAALTGVNLLGGSAHGDFTTVVDHAWAHGRSDQVFKSVLDGRSRGVIQGRVTVREGAIKTDAVQSARSLLLSREAEADAKPELEIFADDVKCAHGATTGALDANAMFYLRSRGVPEADARRLLTAAFIEEAVARAPAGDLADLARAFVAARGYGAET